MHNNDVTMSITTRTSKKTSKLHVAGSLWEASPGDRWITLTKGHCRGKSLHVMTWRMVMWIKRMEYMRYLLGNTTYLTRYIKQCSKHINEFFKWVEMSVIDLPRLNSLWAGDAIWRHGTRSTLALVMACCMTAPNHYLNQYWLVIGEVPWHSSQGIILRWYEDTNQ